MFYDYLFLERCITKLLGKHITDLLQANKSTTLFVVVVVVVVVVVGYQKALPYDPTTTMLALTSWLGGVSLCLPTPKLLVLDVYSKLGGNKLGQVKRPLLDRHNKFTAFQTLRDVQDQIATFFAHPKRPPRYIAIFVGQVRLTPKNFMFAKTLYRQTCDVVQRVLQGAESISVMYDEDDKDALASLINFDISFVSGVLNVACPVEVYTILLPQLEVACFDYSPVKTIKSPIRAFELGSIACFPFLEELCITGCLQFAATIFYDLYQSRVKRLTITFELLTLPHGVDLMVNLTSFDVTLVPPYKTQACQTIPSELGLLTNLKSLAIRGDGFGGHVPRQIGQLPRLTALTIRDTRVTTLPTELGDLACLEHLDLECNTRLRGDIPSSLNHLTKLRTIRAQHTNNLCKSEITLPGTWTDDTWTSSRC